MPVDILDMGEEMSEEERTSPLLYSTDEFIKAVTQYCQRHHSVNFLMVQEAKRIAKEVMDGRESIDRKELDEKVIKIIRKGKRRRCRARRA